MADAVVSVLVSTILGNINSFLAAEMGIVRDLNNELQKLESSLSTVQAVLQDAEQKQGKGKAINNWLRKLKAVACDIENTFDEFATEALGRRLHPGLTNQVSRFFSPRNALFHRLKTAHRLRTLREKLDFIAKEKDQFHLKELGDPEAGEPEWRQTSSLVTELETFGRDEEVESIVGLLINQVGDNDETSVVSICGMGGLGKTTLAQLVYNDERVVGVFDLRIWVCVSDDFDIRRLTRAIIESIEGKQSEIQELDPLQRRLQEKLMGKRFLLVLDDVWNEYEDKWDRLKQVFRYGAKGSTVVVTTRIEKIAIMMSTEPVHYLGCLSDDDSWNLFKRRAFGRSDCEDYSHLEVIGKEIVKKCGGVPLAIKAMGGLMRFKKSAAEWLSVKESELWDLEDEGTNVLPVLRLSYDNLFPYLKQCFAFCSIFPKDYVMRKEQLIQLWMANGFIPSRARMDLHDVGCEIFNELTMRSFFMDVKERVNGKISCKMHDLIHDLALSITRDECFMIDGIGEFEVPKHVHHLSIWKKPSRGASPELDLSKIRSLRSLLFFAAVRISLNSSMNRFLRTLDLRDHHLRESVVVHACKQLRYLDLSHSAIKVLSNSICCLHNLQTINLSNCYLLEMLPEDMNHMKELVYLDITGCYRLICLPASMGKLVHLRKLSIFIVGKENGYRISELQGLDLGGELSIKQLENVKNITEARSANLMGKQNLRSLELFWGSEISRIIVPRESEEDVLGCLQPHPNLKKLTIWGFQGVRLPFWMSESHLPNLIEVELQCERCENLPPLGKLRFLKFLGIYMNSLQYIGSDLYGECEISFPSLEKLTISGDVLKEWKTIEGRENFPHLHKLVISRCPQLSEIPILPSLKDLEVDGCSISLLKALQNFTFLTSLHIRNVDELPAKWLQGHRFLESLVIESATLKSVSIQFDDLRALRYLTFHSLKELEALPEGLGNSTSLRTLNLWGCDSLVSLPANSFCGLSSLSRLSIQNCEKLSSLSDGMQYLTALEDLLIHACPEVTSLPDSIGYLTALRELSILNCKGLTALPNEVDQLTSLSTLQIWSCPNLMCLPEGLGKLTSLRTLDLGQCDWLVSLPANSFRGLSSLSRLSIRNCEKLRSLSEAMQYLTALEDLLINACPEVTSLADSIGYLTALRKLSIWHCKGLTALPNEVDQLTSLSTLEILSCRNLMCLPDGLQNLTTLSVLRIQGCPHLWRRCKKGSGADWPKIAHIPELEIKKYDLFSPSPPGNRLARCVELRLSLVGIAIDPRQTDVFFSFTNLLLMNFVGRPRDWTSRFWRGCSRAHDH